MIDSKTICFVNARFYPDLGGVERYTLELSKKLVDYGYKVIVVTTNIDDNDSYEIFNGVIIYRLPIFKGLGGRYPILKFNKKYFKILKNIKKEDIDFFVINTRFYLTSILGLHIAKSKSKRSIVIEHGTGHFSVNNSLLDFFGRRWEHFVMNIVKLYKPRFYGVSKACNNWLLHFNVTASGVLYNGIDAHYKIKELKNLKSEYQIPNTALIVTYAGRFIQEKGIHVLIKAIEKVLEKNRNVYFFLAGSGPLESMVSEFAIKSDRVFFEGKMDYDDLMNLFRCSDILVNPSMYPEGLPTVILEAGAMGCAIVATARGGTEEIILSKKYGIIISEEDEREIFKAVNDLYNDPTYLKYISSNVKTRIIEGFDWSILALNFIKVIKE
ncbi:glycosyltransferase family 4 protein [uncultured Aquimarina sp.]|uniref:glycosyltransferase family 4 protein n=1 Tax=uncultured Aquimarina sp. TaxID=575652 RepID=UPI002611C7CF|nr:glycosyltransferase family 4 protein [uncultured Aquimarina sp.]